MTRPNPSPPFAALATLLLLGLACCGRDFSLPPHADNSLFPVTLIEPAEDQPRAYKKGDVLEITFGGTVELDRDSCKADLGGQPLLCDAAIATHCSCARTIGDLSDGEQVLHFEATSLGVRGRGNESLWIDNQAPDIDQSKVMLQRQPAAADTLSFQAGVAQDPNADPNHPSFYPKAGIAKLMLWDSATAPLPRMTLDAPLSSTPSPLPGSEGNDSSKPSPKELWVSATDVVDNESARVLIQSGKDWADPTLDPTSLLELLPLEGSLSEATRIKQPSPAIPVATDLGCGVGWVRFYDGPDAASATQLKEIVPSELLSPGIQLGQRVVGVYASALDRCGNESAPQLIAEVQSEANPASTQPVSVQLFDGATTKDPQTMTLPELQLLAGDRAGDSGANGVDSGVFGSSASAVITTPASWTKLNPTTRPPQHDSAALCYDPIHKQTVLFVHSFGSALGETWLYDGGNWTLASPANSPPSLSQAKLVWMSGLGKAVLFGGTRFSDGSSLGGTWTWDGTNWTDASPSPAPSARHDYALAYDSKRRVAVLFGGFDSNSPSLFDTWEFDGSSWTTVPTTAHPPYESGAAMAYSAVRDQVVLFGGIGGNQFTWFYTYSGGVGSWVSLTTSGGGPQPPSVGFPSLSYDSAREVLVLFGGRPAGSTIYSANTWEFSVNGWNQVTTTLAPPARFLHASSYDSNGHALVVTGGVGNSGSIYDDSWEYKPTVSAGASSAWQLFQVHFDEGPGSTTLNLEYVGAGLGASGSGVTLYAWDPDAAAGVGAWVPAGTNKAPLTDTASARTIGVVLGPLKVQDQQLTLMAVAPRSDPPSGGTTQSQLESDSFRVTVTYTRP